MTLVFLGETSTTDGKMGKELKFVWEIEVIEKEDNVTQFWMILAPFPYSRYVIRLLLPDENVLKQRAIVKFSLYIKNQKFFCYCDCCCVAVATVAVVVVV